jgi:hypothetical protein
MDRVDHRSTQAGADFGEGVDGLHDPGVGGGVKGVDPVAYLVHDIDLPFPGHHGVSIPIAKPDGQASS